MLTDRAIGFLQRLDEALCNLRAGLVRVIIGGIVDIPLGRQARDDGFHARLAARSATRLWRRSK